MATTKRCAKLASLIFILKNVIHLFITTEIVELFLYIRKSSGLAPVVQKLDSAIHRINHYPADTYYGKQLRYQLDSDLSAG